MVVFSYVLVSMVNSPLAPTVIDPRFQPVTNKELQNLPRPFFLRQWPSGYTDIEGEVWEIKEPACLE